MKKDEEEFERERSKIKVDELILLGSPLDIDWGEDDEHVIDMDKSIASEANRGCLEKKKKFLITFLTRKLVELGNRKTTARNLSMDRPQRNSGARSEPGMTLLGRDATRKDTTWKDTTWKTHNLEGHNLDGHSPEDTQPS